MKLYCVRHAQALPAPDDNLRELSPEGRLEAQNMANFLKLAQIKPSQIIHSCTTRTQTTAAIIGKTLGLDHITPCATGINSEDNADDMIPVVQAWESDTMIISHLPFIAHLVSKLVAHKDQPNMIHYPPCTIVCLDHVHENQWAFEWMLTPSLLNAE